MTKTELVQQEMFAAMKNKDTERKAYPYFVGAYCSRTGSMGERTLWGKRQAGEAVFAGEKRVDRTAFVADENLRKRYGGRFGDGGRSEDKTPYFEDNGVGNGKTGLSDRE